MTLWDRYAGRRISRRRALQSGAAAGAGAAGLWLIACGGGSRSGGDGATATPAARGSAPGGADIANEASPPRRGGRLRIATPAPFDTFDPHLAVGSSVQLFPRIYNVLVNQSPARPEFMVFDLAESLETPDSTTWILHLRPGVRIGPNDVGVPERDLDGDDVVATFQRIKAEPRSPNGAFVKDFVASVRAEGSTVTITTTKPYAWFLTRVGNFVNAIPPRELIADASAVEKMRSASAGGGPFRLASSTENEGARLERNPSYYLHEGSEALPYVDGIDVRVIPDRSAWRTAFQSQQLDAYAADSKREADSLAADGRFFVIKDPLFQFVPLTMNAEHPPFNDPRARRAVSRAINRRQLIDIIYAGDAKPNGLVHWPCGVGTYAFNEDELDQLQPHDPAEARRLSDALGGLRFKMIYPANTPVVQHSEHVPIILQQMRDAGIGVEESPLEFTKWLGEYRARNYDASLALTQVIETPEFPLNWHTSNGPAGDGSFGKGIGDAEIDEAIERTKTTTDFQERVKAVRDAQNVIYAKDPMFLPLVSPYSYTAYRNAVHNVPAGIGSTALLLNTFWLEG